MRRAPLCLSPASHAGGRWFESISLHQEEPLLGSGSFLAWYSDKWTRKAAPGGMPQPPWLLPQQKRIHSSPSKQTKPNPVTDWCRVRFCLYSQIASAGVQLALAICEIFFSILCFGNTPVSLAADTGQGIRTHNRGIVLGNSPFRVFTLDAPSCGRRCQVYQPLRGAAFFNAARQDSPSLDGLNTGAEFLLLSLLPPPYHKDQIKRCKGDFGRWASGCANGKN